MLDRAGRKFPHVPIAEPGADEIDRHPTVGDDDHAAMRKAVVKLLKERCKAVSRSA